MGLEIGRRAPIRATPAIIGTLLLAAGISIPAAAQTNPAGTPLKALYAIELDDPSGDVGTIGTSSGPVPGLDVVKMALKSDGKRITVTARLKDPPGPVPSPVVNVYFDTDNDAKTGAQTPFPGFGGFEYGARLYSCAGFCKNRNRNPKPEGRYGAMEVWRVKGTITERDREILVDPDGYADNKPSARTPVTANVVEGAIDYGDLGVKPGQTIRVAVEETGGTILTADFGFFPQILLTLR